MTAAQTSDIARNAVSNVRVDTPATILAQATIQAQATVDTRATTLTNIG
ncbi:MAG: hypothetical protein R3E97_11100 [Candidatus Eisenbacteria bacterium]